MTWAFRVKNSARGIYNRDAWTWGACRVGRSPWKTCFSLSPCLTLHACALCVAVSPLDNRVVCDFGDAAWGGVS